MMRKFQTKLLPAAANVMAPDGSEVRLLVSDDKGSMAHFALYKNQVSKAVCHRTVDELWYIIKGSGEMWRSNAEGEEVVELKPGVSLSIPAGTSFQFRANEQGLEAVAVTMPPWPSMAEAFEVKGKWN